ncbi:MAG: cytochrome c family protein [Deltaproteobacteria bacterium]|nr:cytochrome c family protein [Deltaproteobacteria bacterium]
MKYKKIMIPALAAGLVLLLAAVSAWAGGGQSPVKSLDELLQRYDSKRCQECHSEIYEQWSRSHHARSLMGLNGFSFMSKYLRKGPLAVKKPQEATLANFPCAKCHLPQLMNAEPQVAKELAEVVWRDDKAVVSRLNISCLVCHQDKAVVHHHPEPGVLYGPENLPEHEGQVKAVKRSAFMSSPAFCGQCHGMGPNFEFTPPVQCATLYGSYLHAYVADGGACTCLDCHMSGTDHTFPPDFSDQNATAKLYRAALPMQVEVLPYTFHPGHKQNAPQVVVGVNIQNRAGHRIPDG